MPVIASLSLGATRTFRLTRKTTIGQGQANTATPATSGGTGGGSDGTAGGRGGRGGKGGAAAANAPTHDARSMAVSRVDVGLPHNSLAIMWPPCQEEWTHEVSGVSCHVMSGWPVDGME